MNLDEMLALLPDNTSGAIDAADLRAIVTGLFERASTIGQVFSYQWTTATSPAGGRVNLLPGWSGAATTLLLSETTLSGQVLSFEILDNSVNPEIWLIGSSGGRLEAVVSGPSVDMGQYREVPISVHNISGTAPVANDKVQVAVTVTLS